MLLEHLLENAGKVCSKQELLDLVWADVHVGEESVTQAISLIRQALEDDARRPTYVETIQGRGYRFIAEVERETPEPSTAAAERPFGSYEIVERIGVGGMGRVFRARDVRLGRDVAIKVLPKELVDDRDALLRFEREAKLLAALNHANIATLYALEESRGGQFLVMELIEGKTLAECLASGPLPIADVLEVGRQVAAALEAAHARGIVHRDLKPANVMITPDETVKILDFGVAKALDLAGLDTSATSQPTRLTRTGLAVGTPPYMSPEQIEDRDLDERADLWAFGCLLFEALVGRRAFDGDTAASTAAAILADEPDWQALPETTPLRVRLLLERCLKKDPRRRLHHAADARIEIEETLTEITQRGRSDASIAAAGEASVDDGSGGTLGPSRRQILVGGAAVGLGGVGLGLGISALAGQGTVTTQSVPSYDRLTFRKGLVRTARFSDDDQTVLYGALWDGDVCRIYEVRQGRPETAPMSNLPPATPLAISRSGELALTLGDHFRGVMTYGTLATVGLTGDAPRQLLEGVKYADWSPDGRELAVVRRVDGRERLEFPAGERVLAEPSNEGGGFSFLRVSPDGNRLAFFELTSGLTGRVATVGLDGRKEFHSRQYFNVFGLAWNGDEIWFTAAEQAWLFRNAILAVRRDQTPEEPPRVVTRIPGNASLHDIAPDGRVLIARTDDRGGIAVLPPGETREHDLSWLDASRLTGISRDGTSILFTENGVAGGADNTVYLRDTSGAPAVPLGDGAARALSPDGQWAVIDPPGAPDAHLDVVPTGPGQPKRIEHPGFIYGSVQWFPDNQRLLVYAQRRGNPARLHVVDLESGAIDPVTPEGTSVEQARLSPDGTTIAVASGRRVELHPVAGGEPRALPNVELAGLLLAWIDSGFLVSDGQSSMALDTIFRVDPEGGERDVWREIEPRDPAGIMNVFRLEVTPDGSSYGYSWHRALSDLYIVHGLR